jgi:hypothetical protein
LRIVIFAERFESGAWIDWEHTCDETEVAGVQDSAQALAGDWSRSAGLPVFLDYLKGAEYIFDVARGRRSAPAEGDVKVFGVAVDEIVIARYERLKHHFELKRIA